MPYSCDSSYQRNVDMLKLCVPMLVPIPASECSSGQIPEVHHVYTASDSAFSCTTIANCTGIITGDMVCFKNDTSVPEWLGSPRTIDSENHAESNKTAAESTKQQIDTVAGAKQAQKDTAQTVKDQADAARNSTYSNPYSTPAQKSQADTNLSDAVRALNRAISAASGSQSAQTTAGTNLSKLIDVRITITHAVDPVNIDDLSKLTDALRDAINQSLQDAISGIDTSPGSGTEPNQPCTDCAKETTLQELKHKFDVEGALPSAQPEEPPETFYTPEYPDGFEGVWDAKKGALQQTPLFTAIGQLMPVNINSGTCPEFLIEGFVLGINVNGSMSPPCYIWPVLQLIMIVSALFLARRLVFGG